MHNIIKNRNEKRRFTNFYTNLFNILVLLDLGKEKDDSVLLFYNGDEGLYKINKLEEIKDIIKVEWLTTKIIVNENIIYHFNPLNALLDISKETYQRLIDSKILELDYDKNYDIISRRINELTIKAQSNLERYLKNRVKNKKYSIMELLKTMIDKEIDSVYNKYNLNFYGNPFSHIYKSIKIDDEFYLITDHNKVYTKYYIDSLELLILFAKEFTRFQNELVTSDFLKDDLLLKEKIISIFSHLGIFSKKFEEKLKDCMEGSDINLDNIFLSNGSTPRNELCDNRYNSIAIQQISTNNTMYSIPNIISNLYVHLDEINSLIKDKEKRFVLYSPNINLLNKDNFNKLSPLSKILVSLSILTYYTDEIIKNSYIGINTLNLTYELTYGERLKLSSSDPNGYLKINPFNYNLEKTLNKKFLSYFTSSIFDGYIQNNKINIYNGSRIQYMSSVWLRPFYWNELLTSSTRERHIVCYPYLVEDINIKKSNLNDMSFNSSDGINYTNCNVPILQKSLRLNDFVREDKGKEEMVFYNTTLGSIILLRTYIIGILEMISRITPSDNLSRIKDKTESKIFFKYFKLKPIDKAYFSTTFKNTSSVVINGIKTFCNSIKYSTNSIYSIRDGLKYFKLNDDSKIEDDDENSKIVRELYINSFYSFFIDSFRINSDILERINTIAKEDYFTCPLI